jgi:hypothetical protein
MRTCPCCRRVVAIGPESNPRPAVYADSEEQGPFMYLLMFECVCKTTLSFCMWQNEECAAEELEFAAHEEAGAALHQRDEAPLERASYRPFFSLTHEFAELGL